MSIVSDFSVLTEAQRYSGTLGQTVSECNHRANERNLKGQDRKDFVDWCVARNQSYSDAQGNRYSECNARANERRLEGDARRDFLEWCVDRDDRIAITVSNIDYSLGYNKTSFSVKVKCVFVKRKSWTTTADSAVLVHEQGHFDISEMYARKLRKVFKEYKFNPQTVQADLKAILSKLNSDRRLYNELYDIETDASRNPTMQAQWNKRLADELNALKAYAE